MARILIFVITIALTNQIFAQECLGNLDQLENNISALARARSCEKAPTWRECKEALFLTSTGGSLAAARLKSLGVTLRDPKLRPCSVGSHASKSFKEAFADILVPSAYACASEQERVRQQSSVLKQLKRELQVAIDKQKELIDKFSTGNFHWDHDIRKLGQANDAVLTSSNADRAKRIKELSDLENSIKEKYKGVKDFESNLASYNQARANINNWNYNIKEIENSASVALPRDQYKVALTRAVPGSQTAENIIKAELGTIQKEEVIAALRTGGRGLGIQSVAYSKPTAQLVTTFGKRLVVGVGGALVSGISMAAEPSNSCVANTMKSPLIMDPQTCQEKTEMDDVTDRYLDLSKADYMNAMKTGGAPNGVCEFLQGQFKTRYSFKASCQENKVSITQNGEKFEINLDPQGEISTITRNNTNGAPSTAIFRSGELIEVRRKDGSKFLPSQQLYYEPFRKLRVAATESISCCRKSGVQPADEECRRYLGLNSSGNSTTDKSSTPGTR